MATPHAVGVERPASSSGVIGPLAAALFVVGLLGHVFAARAMGGYRIAYLHHVAGFFIILAVTGPVIALLGWWYWRRGRRDAMWLAIGALQALFGIMIYASQVRLFGFHLGNMR